MSVDYRREWIKERVVQYLGLPDGSYFDDMLAADDGELEDKLDTLLDDDILLIRDSHKKMFYVYKTSYEKLVDEEILVPQIGKFYNLQLELKVFNDQTEKVDNSTTNYLCLTSVKYNQRLKNCFHAQNVHRTF